MPEQQANSATVPEASEQRVTVAAESDHAHRLGVAGLGEGLCVAAPGQRTPAAAELDHAHSPGFAGR
eukprot:14728568-Alexandrium_andersonii.AAC.1